VARHDREVLFYFRAMGFKQTRLYAMIAGKCPQCGKGDLFKHSNAYDPKKTALMNDSCPVCGEDFKREPGFYFGAAYVSYALTVALWVAVLVALYTFDALGWIEFGFYTHVSTFLITGISTLLLLLPGIYRLSRTLWLHMLTKQK
jgi:uncharacterized protein (DUF983 family)